MNVRDGTLDVSPDIKQSHVMMFTGLP